MVDLTPDQLEACQNLLFKCPSVEVQFFLYRLKSTQVTLHDIACWYQGLLDKGVELGMEFLRSLL